MNKSVHFIIFITALVVITACSPAPGHLVVQLKPDRNQVEYVRVYESGGRHLARDIRPKGRGQYEAIFSNPGEITVVVKALEGRELQKNTVIQPGVYSYLEFNVVNEKKDVEFIRLKTNRELNYRPINKGQKNKSIYVSYIDYIGQNLALTGKIENNLKKMGYQVLHSVNSKTELIASINLIDFSSAKHVGGLNRQTVNKYKFKIKIEQRIAGSTVLEESYASARLSPDSTSYDSESYPLDDSIREPPSPRIIPVAATVDAEKAESPGLLVKLGLAEDEQKEEEAEETKEEEAAAPAEDPAMAANQPPAEQEEKKEEAKEEEKPADESLPPGVLNSRKVTAKSELKFHPYKDEIIVDASIRLVNLTSKDEQAVDKIVDLLSDRLARIFNL